MKNNYPIKKTNFPSRDGFTVMHQGKKWTPKILARHAAKGKGQTWAEDALIKVQRGTRTMDSVLRESQLPGRRVLKLRSLVYISGKDRMVYTPRKIQNYVKEHYGQEITLAAAAHRIRKAKRNPIFDEHLLEPNQRKTATRSVKEDVVYTSEDGIIYTVEKVQAHLKQYFDHDISENAAATRIKKAIENPELEYKILLPNRTVLERDFAKRDKLNVMTKEAIEIQRREEEFHALENPGDEEMWQNQERILASY